MNGIDFLADTNFLIHVHEGNPLAEPFLDYNFATSYISEIELLGVFSINKTQQKALRELLEDCIIIEMNQQIKELCIKLKQKYKIKIPDAIIAASSIIYGLPLITSDADFKSIDELSLIFIEK
ncbi:MAG: type II toxin-antitoxin system VapC family toxin [Flavobacteriaceae bacterium]|jgi:predicted nucleic acid-binding protein|nr:type II toxin-antitoxin system VapC family toxin [Flavobacteriaceae bacterium]